MGIDGTWKSILKEEFTWPPMPDAAMKHITTVIDDLSLNIRRVMSRATSFEQLGERLRARIAFFTCEAALVEYIAFVDEGQFVPSNKSITQRVRDERAENRPFTEAECRMFTIGVDPIPEEMVPNFFERLMATRRLHREFYAFIAAELAMTALRPGVTLILDVLPAKMIMQRQMRGDPVELTNIRVPQDDQACMSDIELGKIDHPMRLFITKNTDRPGNRVFIRDSTRIGESDLKIIDTIARLPSGSKVFVRSCDTDMLVLILLHMRNFVNMDPEDLCVAHGDIRYDIYLDTEGPGRKEGADPVPYLDMVELWRSIMHSFRARFTQITKPIEMLALLMLITGSDYVERLARFGARTVWKAFTTSTARDILFPMTVNESPEPAVVIDRVYGRPQVRLNVSICERNIYKFIVYVYHRETQKDVPFIIKRSDIGESHASRKVAIARLAAQAAKKGKEPSAVGQWMPPTAEAIMGFVRRLAWNMDYCINGTKDPAFFAPLETVDLHEGTVSVHGWARDPESNLIVITNHIWRS